MKTNPTDLSPSQYAYLTVRKKERRLILFLRIAVLILFLILWEWTARYGSRIAESFLENQSRTAARMLMTVTRRKLTTVSYRVTDKCGKILLSSARFRYSASSVMFGL